ncbi:hypothetical protein QIS74_04918 [Colletotrichum tabaci]|uniref:Uncharacterized protein n=1 Tax=Colletotrichum tabaci TaxID=1209068 RepID=A0AAV9THC7_9PEZI
MHETHPPEKGMARDADTDTEAGAEAAIRIDFKHIVEKLREAVHLAIAHENTQPVFRKRLEPGKRQAQTSSKTKPNSKIRIRAPVNMHSELVGAEPLRRSNRLASRSRFENATKT